MAQGLFWPGLPFSKAAVLVAMVCLAATSIGAAPSGPAGERSVSRPPGAGGLRVWLVPATQKIFPDTLPPAAAYSGRVSVALGELEAIQLALRADRDLKNVRITVQPRGSSGLQTRPPIAPEWIELFEVLYVPTPADKSHPQWPDPLVPLPTRPATVDLQAGQTKAVWIRLRIPPTATPCACSLVATVQPTSQGADAVSVTVPVTIWPFRLPRRTHLRTAFGISGGYIALQHAVKRDTDEYAELYRRYYDELLDHRICAYHVPYGILDPRALPYLRDERVNAFLVPYTEDEARLREYWQHLWSVGAAHKAWIYPLDEPVNRKAYETLKKRASYIHRTVPGLPVCSPFYRGPDWDASLTPFDELVGYLDIWCCNTHYYHRSPKIQRLMHERQRAGEEAWCYVCCGPGSPYCNFFVNMTALQHRILMWQMYSHRIQGLLYWSTTYWNPRFTKDPFKDMATVKHINPNIYGDGSLLYPGSKVGIDGPVSSIRLECIRDGLEDFEYLVLAARVVGKDATGALVAQVTRSMIDYVRDPQQFEAIRRRIGEMLSSAK